jgi:hypothetical protein
MAKVGNKIGIICYANFAPHLTSPNAQRFSLLFPKARKGASFSPLFTINIVVRIDYLHVRCYNKDKEWPFLIRIILILFCEKLL